MATKARSEFISPTDTVSLTALFKDQNGNPANLDSFPQISIIAPSGLVTVGPTSAGVSQISTGKYQYDFKIGFAGPLGVWIDNWVGFLQGFRIEASFNFVVANTQMPGIQTDGYEHLGQDVGFDYSQIEIHNINKLIKTLRTRLNSSGKSKSKDAFGNVIYVNCDIFSVDQLVSCLANSLTWFNEVPHFTFFSFADTQIIDQFHDVIVEGATLMALASEALISRGLEYTITDSGVSFNPPSMSELLNTQYTTELTHYYDKLKFIKNSMKPSPIGLGSFTLSGSAAPAFRRLRLLRERQLV